MDKYADEWVLLVDGENETIIEVNDITSSGSENSYESEEALAIQILQGAMEFETPLTKSKQTQLEPKRPLYYLISYNHMWMLLAFNVLVLIMYLYAHGHPMF